MKTKQPRAKHIVRYVLMLGIALTIALLVRTAYDAGLYSGDRRCRVEAMNAGAGHFLVWVPGQPWVWTPDPILASFLEKVRENDRLRQTQAEQAVASPPRLQGQRSRF